RHASLASVSKLPGLAESGLLSFFSVFGWQVEDDADPQLPPGKYDHDWTSILYHPGNHKALQRRRTPSGVNSFKAAKVDLVPIICFPTHTRQPAVAKLNWKVPRSFRCRAPGRTTAGPARVCIRCVHAPAVLDSTK